MRDYYKPVNPEQGLAENQNPMAGAAPTEPGGPLQGSEGSQPDSGAMDETREQLETARQKAAEYRTAVMEQAEAGKERAASGLEKAASELRERTATGAGDGMQGQVGTKVAQGLERTAGYLREHETSEIWTDLENYVRQHPMQAAVSALATGFIIGRALR